VGLSAVGQYYVKINRYRNCDNVDEKFMSGLLLFRFNYLNLFSPLYFLNRAGSFYLVKTFPAGFAQYNKCATSQILLVYE
jgi:hypothetical protein